jgi:hypothetical protein
MTRKTGSSGSKRKRSFEQTDRDRTVEVAADREIEGTMPTEPVPQPYANRSDPVDRSTLAPLENDERSPREPNRDDPQPSDPTQADQSRQNLEKPASRKRKTIEAKPAGAISTEPPNWFLWARVAAFVTLGTAIIALISLGGARLRKSLEASVNDRPEYQFAFADIELDPAPPNWIKLGKEGLLERVRVASKRPKTASILTTDPEGLRRDFQLHSPWVEEVERVELKYPKRVIVRPKYREPAAFASIKGNIPIYLDSNGVILPTDELNLGASGVLPPIYGLENPSSTAPGVVWSKRAGRDDYARPNPRAVAAARLAKFLKDRQNPPLGSGRKPRRVEFIHAQYPAGLFVQLTGKIMVLWGDAPGSERPGTPSGEKKWAILRDWIEHDGPETLRPGDYVEFSAQSILVHPKTPKR